MLCEIRKRKIAKWVCIVAQLQFAKKQKEPQKHISHWRIQNIKEWTENGNQQMQKTCKRKGEKHKTSLLLCYKYLCEHLFLWGADTDIFGLCIFAICEVPVWYMDPALDWLRSFLVGNGSNFLPSGSWNMRIFIESKEYKEVRRRRASRLEHCCSFVTNQLSGYKYVLSHCMMHKYHL
jgi:hypothetical protein